MRSSRRTEEEDPVSDSCAGMNQGLGKRETWRELICNQMEVSVLLRKLDSLNEEGNKVQQEMQSVDSELSEAVLQYDVLSQVSVFRRTNFKKIKRTKKKMREMHREDPATAITLETKATYRFPWQTFVGRRSVS